MYPLITVVINKVKGCMPTVVNEKYILAMVQCCKLLSFLNLYIKIIEGSVDSDNGSVAFDTLSDED